MDGVIRVLKREGVCATCGAPIAAKRERVFRVTTVTGRRYGMSICRSCMGSITGIYTADMIEND